MDIAVLSCVSAFGLLCQWKWPKAKWALALPTTVLLADWAVLNVISGPMTWRTWLFAMPLLFPTVLTPVLATYMFWVYRRRVGLFTPLSGIAINATNSGAGISDLPPGTTGTGSLAPEAELASV